MEGFSLRQEDQPSKEEQVMVSNIFHETDNIKKAQNKWNCKIKTKSDFSIQRKKPFFLCTHQETSEFENLQDTHDQKVPEGMYMEKQ